MTTPTEIEALEESLKGHRCTENSGTIITPLVLEAAQKYLSLLKGEHETLTLCHKGDYRQDANGTRWHLQLQAAQGERE